MKQALKNFSTELELKNEYSESDIYKRKSKNKPTKGGLLSFDILL